MSTTDTSAQPDDAPVPRSAIGPALNKQCYYVGRQRALLLAGDDLDAKADVSARFQDASCFTIDVGDLITGGQMQQIGGPLAGANLIRLPDPN